MPRIYCQILLLCALQFQGLAQTPRCEVGRLDIGGLSLDDLYGQVYTASFFLFGDELQDTTLTFRVARVSDSLDWTEYGESLIVSPSDLFESSHRSNGVVFQLLPRCSSAHTYRRHHH